MKFIILPINSVEILYESLIFLIYRYELQADNSLLGEYIFSYDASWFQGKMKECLDFWIGNKEPKYVAEDETWKCQYCKFTSVCPLTSVPASTPQ
jgi:exonuclease V